MLAKQIENLVFKNKSKDELIKITMSSLSGLLADVYTGDDVNALKKEFPEGIKIEDISVQLNASVIYLDSKEFSVPCIEIAIDIIHEKSQYEIGTYSLIFDVTCEQIDEVLVIN
ncbi:MAG: hypothetical protein PF485_02385 [Bacteroidales bacterium]|jgi:hypothetical protein|nr:hypothetical protein [Bacteroidales bacterium]